MKGPASVIHFLKEEIPWVPQCAGHSCMSIFIQIWVGSAPLKACLAAGWEQSVHKSTWDVLCIHVWAASNWLGSSGFLLYFGY